MLCFKSLSNRNSWKWYSSQKNNTTRSILRSSTGLGATTVTLLEDFLNPVAKTYTKSYTVVFIPNKTDKHVRNSVSCHTYRVHVISICEKFIICAEITKKWHFTYSAINWKRHKNEPGQSFTYLSSSLVQSSHIEK